MNRSPDGLPAAAAFEQRESPVNGLFRAAAFNNWQPLSITLRWTTTLAAGPMITKRYRIEDSFGLPPAASATEAPVESGASSARLDEILGAINDLKRLTQASAGETIEMCRRELTEAFAMRGELDKMKDAITRTKEELAALHRSENHGKGMRRAADELDAVVESTERATSNLLTAIEDIETNANMLRAQRLSKAGQDNVDIILERVVSAYEACNFQDLTGQRISKIVGVMKFVEDHLDRVLDAWGGLEGFRDIIGVPAGPSIDDESSLLNGPKLEDDIGHVDQTDIDSLFD